MQLWSPASKVKQHLHDGDAAERIVAVIRLIECCCMATEGWYSDAKGPQIGICASYYAIFCILFPND